MLSNDEMNKIVRKHKAALTRAKKIGPEAVLEAVKAAYKDFDEKLPAWPDNWHTWNIAQQDATMEIQRSRGRF